LPLGYIDAVTSSGWAEGWAFDEQRPGAPLIVAVQDAHGAEIALGPAQLYRRDLAETGHSYGWCAFRLRLTKPVSQIRAAPVQLIAKISRERMFGPEVPRYRETPDDAVETVADLIAADPTVIASLDQIDGCNELFDAFIMARGVEGFVRAAYVYVLGRSIDGDGLANYTRLLRQKRLTPYALLWTLADSEEFRSRPRSLMAPTAAGFPFKISA
jgi:hypothetical protein